MTHFLPQTVPQPVEIVEFAHFLRERQNPRYSATLYDTTPLGECYPARLIYIERQAIIQPLWKACRRVRRTKAEGTQS
jgi:hypothetical protein